MLFFNIFVSFLNQCSNVSMSGVAGKEKFVTGIFSAESPDGQLAYEEYSTLTQYNPGNAGGIPDAF